VAGSGPPPGLFLFLGVSTLNRRHIGNRAQVAGSQSERQGVELTLAFWAYLEGAGCLVGVDMSSAPHSLVLLRGASDFPAGSLLAQPSF